MDNCYKIVVELLEVMYQQSGYSHAPIWCSHHDVDGAGAGGDGAAASEVAVYLRNVYHREFTGESPLHELLVFSERRGWVHGDGGNII